MMTNIGTGQRDVTTRTAKGDFQTLLHILESLGIFAILSFCLVISLGWYGVVAVFVLFCVGGGIGALVAGVRQKRAGMPGRAVACFAGTVACAGVLLIALLNLPLLRQFWPVPQVEMQVYPAVPAWTYTAEDGRILENGYPLAGVTDVYTISGHVMEARGDALWVDDVPTFEYVIDYDPVEADVIPEVNGRPVKILGVPVVLSESFMTTWRGFRGLTLILCAVVIIAILAANPSIIVFVVTQLRELSDASLPAPRDKVPGWAPSWAGLLFNREARRRIMAAYVDTISPPPQAPVIEKTTEIRGVRRPYDPQLLGDALPEGPAVSIGGGTTQASIRVPQSIAPDEYIEALADAMIERNRTESDPDKRVQFSRAMGMRAGWTDPGWRKFCEWLVIEALAFKPDARTYQFTDPAGLDWLSAYGFEDGA